MGDWAAFCTGRTVKCWLGLSTTKVIRALISGRIAEGREVKFAVKDDEFAMKP